MKWKSAGLNELTENLDATQRGSIFVYFHFVICNNKFIL